jgi:hypothetical protein
MERDDARGIQGCPRKARIPMIEEGLHAVETGIGAVGGNVGVLIMRSN